VQGKIGGDVRRMENPFIKTTSKENRKRIAQFDAKQATITRNK